MRILFDQGTPDPLRPALTQHEVATAYELGWSTLPNGELLAAAERSGYDILITTDAKLRYQQNLTGRRLAVVVLLSTSWPRIQAAVAVIVEAVDRAVPGSYTEVEIPQ